MKRILVNAREHEEVRVANVDGQHLIDLDIERIGKEQKKANIYKGRITRIEPSLDAAFVDYGAERHGFLPLKEISKEYFQISGENQESGRVHIKEVLKENQEIVVQIAKEERGTKGAALTTFISLAGCYLVLMPNNPKAGGISRRIEGDERDELKAIIDKLEVPETMGLIVRTAGVGKTQDDLKWDLNYLIHIWDAIKAAATEKAAPYLIHQESDVIVRAIRDHLRKDIGEILIDNEALYEKAKNYVQLLRPDSADRVKYYHDRVPLFSRFQIETQIESAFKREVRLHSGGALVIDHTEALVSIDINSARSTKGGDIEETALSTNLEAAEEIARQLRLRDIGGLIVIDFIDMTPIQNQREVENRLRDALRYDRARVQVGRISRFGLLEMSRQRIRPSLGESVQDACPRCNGQGIIRGVESISLSIMRLIEEETLKDPQSEVHAQLPTEVATYLLNEKRVSLAGLESRHSNKILIIPNQYLQTPNYEIKRVKIEIQQDGVSSYEMLQKHPSEFESPTKTTQAPQAEPAVKQLTPPPLPRSSNQGIIKRFLSSLFGTQEEASVASTAVKSPSEAGSATESRQDTRSENSRDKGRRNNRRNTRNRRGGNRQRSSQQAQTEAKESTTPTATNEGDKKRREKAPSRNQSRNNKRQQSHSRQENNRQSQNERQSAKQPDQPNESYTEMTLHEFPQDDFRNEQPVLPVLEETNDSTDGERGSSSSDGGADKRNNQQRRRRGNRNYRGHASQRRRRNSDEEGQGQSNTSEQATSAEAVTATTKEPARNNPQNTAAPKPVESKQADSTPKNVTDFPSTAAAKEEQAIEPALSVPKAKTEKPVKQEQVADKREPQTTVASSSPVAEQKQPENNKSEPKVSQANSHYQNLLKSSSSNAQSTSNAKDVEKNQSE